MIRHIFLDETDSTNNYAKSLKDFDGGLTVIRAARQTGGRGRNGNTFFSDHPGGVWASIITPITDISTHFTHNRAISLAILESLKKSGGNNAQVSIKWPNDVYWGDKKIVGILLENIPEKTDALVIGFGINVNIAVSDFPAALKDIVTSVLIETGREWPLEDLFEDILNGYSQYVNGDQAAIHKLYCDNLYKKGCRATVDQYAGTFVTVDIDGRIRLDTGHGEELLSSGTLRFLGDGGNE